MIRISVRELGEVVTGHTPPTSKREYYGDSIPFLKPTDMVVGQKYTYFTEEGYSDLAVAKYKGSLIPKGATCVVCIGTLGEKMSMAHCNLFTNQSINSIIPNKKYDQHYVYYLLKHNLHRVKALNKGTASGREFVSKSMFLDLEIDVIEDVLQQKKIAQVLSAYDDLIENNQKQIKLLEEAAQRLYKEWFVDLRFPGHENVKIIDGVPEGWKVGRADNFFDITIGKTPPRAEKQFFVNGNVGVPWVSIADMGNSETYIFKTSEGLTHDAIEKHNVKVVPEGTILVSFKLTLGRVSITTKEMCTNEAIAHFRINEPALREYTYSYLKYFKYDTLGNTSSISKAVNSKIIKGMPFVMPSGGIVQLYSKIVSPIFNLIRDKQALIVRLSEAQDRLLPKLMSGEIELGD